jgi:PKD domain
MRRFVITALTVFASLVAAGGAQAVVVNDQGVEAGVALVPGTSGSLAAAGVSPVTSSVSTCDPWLSSDLTLLPSIGLCYHGGAVMHHNETFALTWDPNRWDPAGTRDYLEQFLQDVANGSGTLSSPYAVTSQYADGTPDSVDSTDTIGRAENSSLYGGACIDYGNPGGYTCQFGDTTGTGDGQNYPANVCTPSPGEQVCLTDAQLQTELSWDLGQTELLNHLEPGYTPQLVLLTPPGVEICLDSAGDLCSANGDSTAQFCSYHSQMNYDGTDVAYVVQPWTANTACDEPDLPPPAADPTAQQIAVNDGMRLASSLSQSQIAAITNPYLNGWYAEDGSEIDDNDGCAPAGDPADSATVGTSSQNPYFLAPEFNNAGVIDTDPEVPECANSVTLAPSFVAPSPVEPGDVVQFDGSVTDSTLIVPKSNYSWNFGDGGTAVGPSVEHSYTNGGTYTVTLKVTDRGGNVASFSQTISILGPTGQPVTPPTSPTVTHTAAPFSARIQLMPQGLRSLLRKGLSISVSSDEAANGLVTVAIPRSAAKRAHIKTGRSKTVVVGRGTVSDIVDGTASLRVRFSRSMAKKLGRLTRVTLTVRLALTAAGGAHVAVDAAGRY